MRTDSILILSRPGFPPEAFGSIKAIFDHVPPDEIGLPIRKVWGAFKEGDTLDTGKVIIYKTTVKRRVQNKERSL